MRKTLGILLAILLMSTTASAMTLTFENWQFNPGGAISGLNSTFSPIDEITLDGNALINGVAGFTPISGSFEEYGTFQASHFRNDDANISAHTTRLGLDYEMTFVLYDTAGTFAFNPSTNQTDLTFTQAKMDIYLDDLSDNSTYDYGTDDGKDAGEVGDVVFGANDGTLIAAFDLLAGSGSIDFDAVGGADGSTDVTFKGRDGVTGLTNGLLANVWFTEDGTDMSTFPIDYLVSMYDTNNDVAGDGAHPDVSQTLFDEYNGQDDLTAENFNPDEGAANDNFFVRTNGSKSLGVVPEPTTMLLFGFGLLGIAGMGRRKA